MSYPSLILQLPVYLQALLEQCTCPGVVTLTALQQSLDEQRPGDVLLVVDRSGE